MDEVRRLKHVLATRHRGCTFRVCVVVDARVLPNGDVLTTCKCDTPYVSSHFDRTANIIYLHPGWRATNGSRQPALSVLPALQDAEAGMVYWAAT